MSQEDDGQKKPKDNWDKIQVLGALLTPVLIASFGLRLDTSIRERDLQIKDFEVAVGILKEDPAKNPGSERLRGWALETFEKYSSVKLSDQDRQRIELWRLNTPTAINVATEPVDPENDSVLYITSVPPGATVYIDGVQQGLSTDAFYWTKPGQHHVKWENKGKAMEHDVMVMRSSEVVWMWVDFVRGQNWDALVRPGNSR